ncbi:uncharacterized protein F5Z01DRAFT_692015 [Emericellopsis atlantica]|uniref:Carrier domain-containing protein n=1 Tax=Emericellopsis atlantica TaxID=2614577 RepID=A0A9P8CM34_9HYPO|nr:uncharacterized protein F5Z01DRAFT_692015 [Emericellopsis atlantica]KAG9251640.1 hypothetical protein F5Z01DRAFT_692015 [Emericellopsis atlantica]
MGIWDATPQPTYFTCTLAQAIQLRAQDGCQQPAFTTVLDLLEKQSIVLPQALALGFADFTSGNSAASCIITFQRLHALSYYAAETLKDRVEQTSKPGNIGLLCVSGIEYTLTWLGLVRLGYSVLFIAPQLEPKAIESLCDTLQVKTVFVHGKFRDRVSSLSGHLDIQDVPEYDSGVDLSTFNLQSSDEKVPEVAYYCHTSGTSSGQPKPVPQYHEGMIAALHPIHSEDRHATFSTTPLYHGGFPDCFRAWSSGSMVWFFTEGAAPITGRNVHKAVRFAQEATGGPLIKYFSSVPYILQLLAEEERGLALLREMDIVGVGGAALATKAGDDLVAAGVNLVSRMGSAECGFLMSSHRDFGKDKEWQYLRAVQDVRLLQFEPQGDGLSELVVKPSWPCLVKTNRDDGSYATSDLFEPHPTIANAWRYHSRADAQITLANGKKFDPSPVEASIVASSRMLVDVLVFGGGREYAGALLFVKDGESATDEDIMNELWPVIRDLNDASQSHTRISKAMLRVVRAGYRPLEKSSKGTIIRSHAEKTYAQSIEALYSGSNTSVHIGDGDISTIVGDCFFEVTGKQLDPEIDLYQQGVDSITCVQVRKILECRVLGQTKSLPLNIIYDQGTILGLERFLKDASSDGQVHGVNGNDHTGVHQRMRDLVTKYSRRLGGFNAEKHRTRQLRPRTVLLTGGTGFLGSHILDLLSRDPDVQRVYCLLRADTDATAHQRVSQSLNDRKLAPITETTACVSSNLGDGNLGLSPEAKELLRKNPPTHIIHAAWAVNFALRLDSFESQIASTANLLNFAAESGAHFTFVSSTAAVTESSVSPIPETLSQDPADASPLGYSQSKWVAEHVCAAAARQALQSSSLGRAVGDCPVSVVRVGQLCSNTMGIWNMSEAYPLMLSTARITGCLPRLENEVLNWLPVEVAAQAVMEASIAQRGQATDDVLHILNSNETLTWTQLLDWIQKENRSQSAELDLVAPRQWLSRLDEALLQHPEHPSQALLGLWKRGMSGESRPEHKAPLQFSMDVTKAALPVMANVVPLDKNRIVRTWRWVQQQRS